MRSLIAVLAVAGACGVSSAQVLQYGDADLLGTGVWSSDPTAGATLTGLAPGAVTFGSLVQGHAFPFDPSADEFAGTDQIYVGSNQTGSSDGYSAYAGRKQTAQVLKLDYSTLVDGTVDSLTLGIAADDFQHPAIGNLFTASINGVVFQSLTDALNALNQTGPVTQFLTIGVPVSMLDSTNVLTLTIDEAGSGSDGWAVDFLTVGVKTVPTPGFVALGAAGAPLMLRRRRK